MSEIVIEALDAQTMALWRTVCKIARELERERTQWCLVGGLMVSLFAIEARRLPRATRDIDILGDARERPSATERVTSGLLSLGGKLETIGGLGLTKGFRFEVDGQLVDVLAPDGLARAALTDGQFQTIQIPGGTQALRRSETVAIVVDGERTALRRPTLLGAILLKTRSLKVHERRQDQREDLLTLLGIMQDPRAAASELHGSERSWLRAADPLLNLNDESLRSRFDEPHLRTARAAYALLTK
ncbi:MAG TPA: hypothetical protein VGL37_05325 [Solirubrobacteraceae bacterium]